MQPSKAYIPAFWILASCKNDECRASLYLLCDPTNAATIAKFQQPLVSADLNLKFITKLTLLKHSPVVCPDEIATLITRFTI